MNALKGGFDSIDLVSFFTGLPLLFASTQWPSARYVRHSSIAAEGFLIDGAAGSIHSSAAEMLVSVFHASEA